MTFHELLTFRKINFDDSLKDFKIGDIAGARNVRIGRNNGEAGSAEAMLGNVKTTNPNLPPGNNTCIGSHEDKKEDSLFFFLYNDLGNHGIYRYFRITDTIEVVRISSVFNFDKTHLITGTDYVENLLYWTDYTNAPRKINVKKSNDTNKLRAVNIYFDKSALLSVSQLTYTVNVYSNTSSLLFSAPVSIPSTPLKPVVPTDLFELCQQFTLSYRLNPGIAGMDAIVKLDSCGNYIKASFQKGYEGACTISITPSASRVFVIPDNYYSSPFKEEFIDLIKYPQGCQPKVSYLADVKRNTNYVQNKVFQFKTRLVYDDSEKSTTSPVSEIPIDSIGCADTVTSFNNYIEIDFSDQTRFGDLGALSIVKKVEIFVREHNIGLFKHVVTLNQVDFISDFKYRFYNDGNYLAISENDSNLLSHNVPLVAKSLKLAKNRLFLGGTKRGYDNICVDAKIEPTYRDAPSTTLYTVSGRIYIKNQAPQTTQRYKDYQPIHDYGNGPSFGGFNDYILFNSNLGHVADQWDQRLPLGGFTAYLAGTNHVGVSKQSIGKHPEIQTNGVYDSHSGQTFFSNGNIALIRDDIENLPVYSDFKIVGVPAGVYILRLASHLTTQADLNDVNKGYQNTSTNAYAFQGNPAHEATIIVSGDTFIDNIYVADLTAPSLPENGTGLTGYLTDQDLVSPSGAQYLNDTRIEKALIYFDMAPSHRVVLTDHNGYFFVSFYFQSNAISIAGVTLTSASSGSYTNLSPAVKDLSGNAFNTTSVGINHSATIIARSTSPDIQIKGRTGVKGYVKSATDQRPMAGIGVAITNTGRFVKTDKSGLYDIYIYPDTPLYLSSGASARQESVLIVSDDSSCVISASPPIVDFNIQILPTPALYNNAGVFGTNHYSLRDIFGSILGQGSSSSFKQGFEGQFGIVYYDKANRSTFVNSSDILKKHVTFQTELDKNTGKQNAKGLVQLHWEIKNTPPAFATHYQWVRTKNLQEKNFIQIVAKSVLFLDDTNTSVVYDSSTKYKIDITNLTADYIARYPNAKIAYTFSPGDRVRFIKTGGGAYYPQYIDLEVLSFTAGNIFVEKDNRLGPLDPGALMEIYTPKPQDETLIFYEFGECYEVASDVNGNRYHKGGFGADTQDQDPLNPISHPAKGTFKTGDVYIRLRELNVVIAGVPGSRQVYVEDQAISDFYTSTDQSIGRVNELNLDAHTIEENTEVCFSNVFIQDTKINGLSAFEPLNRKQLPNEYGLINKLVLFGADVLLAMHDHSKMVSMYIGQAQFKDISGQQIVALSDDVIGSVSTLQEEFGTQNPESVYINNQGQIYFVDRRKSAVVRYANNGLYAVSLNNAISHFADVFAQVNKNTSEKVRVIGVFDRTYWEYILSVAPITGPTPFPGETITYSETNEGFISQHDFLPEYFGETNSTIVAFKNGELWVQNKNETRCNFFGVQYKPMVRVAAYANYDKVKVWNSIAISGNKAWYCTEAITEDNKMFGGIMKTSMSLQKVRGKEGKFYVEFNRDVNTPNTQMPLLNGRRMRSQALEIELTTDETTESLLQEVNVTSTMSEKS